MIAARLPVRALHRRARRTPAVDGHELLEVAGHVEHPEGARAARVSSRRRAQIAKLAGRAEEIRAVGVAGARIAFEAVGVRPHLFTFTGEVPFALPANALAEPATRLVRVGKALEVLRQRRALRHVLVRVDTELQVTALLRTAGRRPVLGAAKLLVAPGSVEVAL